MDADTAWRTIDQQRADLADLFDDLSDAEWATDSLCSGWTVRAVAAHLTLAQMGPLPATLALARARGSFNRMIHDTAVRRAGLPVERYAVLLRAMIGSRRKAPGISHLEPLTDTLVHGQDIAIPLGRRRAMPVEAAAATAARCWSMSFPFHARRRLSGLNLVATDADLSLGSGEPVEGPASALLLVITGRSAGVRDLGGPGRDRLEAALRR